MRPEDAVVFRPHRFLIEKKHMTCHWNGHKRVTIYLLPGPISTGIYQNHKIFNPQVQIALPRPAAFR